MKIAILGLGEAGAHFANDLAVLGWQVTGWDPAPARALHPSVRFAASNPDAVADADIVWSVNLSAVSADIAEEVAPHLAPGALYCEMNTSAPAMKRHIEAILLPSGVHFVDLAIMAPVPGKGIQVPMLASGSGAAALARTMSFLKISLLNEPAGAAAARKLLRSIVYKGVAAVICEAMETASHFDLETYMRQQIHTIIGEDDELIDRFLEGSRTHALRRSHEMEAVVLMLHDAGQSAYLSQAAVEHLKKYLSESK